MFTKRFWVYSHGVDGELNKDLGEHDNLGQAIEAVRKRLSYSRPMFDADVIRITERDKYGNYNTVWIAGPVSYIKDAFPND